MSEKFDPLKINFLYRALISDANLSEKLSIFPHEISRFAYNKIRLQEIQDFITGQKETGKRAVLLFAHDNDYPISTFLQGSPIVFRYSMSKNHSYIAEHMIPTNVTQFALTAASKVKKSCGQRPQVSFMGWSGILKPIGTSQPAEEVFEKDQISNSRGLISPLIFPTPANIGVVLRHRAIDTINKDSRIDSNFKVHDNYFYHHSESFKLKMRQEYINSICNSHYVLAFRGCGNYSIRLFEAMSAGRIPVMLDTNQHLPFEDFIPWHELGVWLPLNQLDSVGERIVEKHQGFDQSKFNGATASIEEIYNDHLSRNAVIMHIKRILESYL